MNKHKVFSIGDTAKITGVSQKQLRHWEARGYIAPPPTRIISGHRAYRYYEQGQVDQISTIKRLLDDGYTLSRASQIVQKEGRNNA